MYGSDAISIALTVLELVQEFVSGPPKQTKAALPTTQRRQVSDVNNCRNWVAGFQMRRKRDSHSYDGKNNTASQKTQIDESILDMEIDENFAND